MTVLSLRGVWVRSNCSVFETFANATVRITLSQEKWPTQGRPFPCRSDIRSAKQKQFSRPMTGHTPQKLPFFRRNLLHHRSATHSFPIHARLYYHHCPILSITFSQIFLLFFVQNRESSLCTQPSPPRAQPRLFLIGEGLDPPETLQPHMQHRLDCKM